MSAPDAPEGPPAEYDIDLGGIEQSSPPRSPEPPPATRTRRLPRFTNAALAYATILIALAAAVTAFVKWEPLRPPIAEATVTAFLEAVREGDVERALSYTEDPDLTGDFLVREALDPRWRIVTVKQVEFQDSRGNPGRTVAKVYAEIEAYDGTRLGHRYQVGIKNGEARIENGFFRSSAYSPFDRLDVNGVSVPVDFDVGTTSMILLPGLYRFYPDLPSTMAFESPASALALGNQFKSLGSDRSDVWVPVPWPHLSDEGLKVVEAAVRDYYDACAADPAIERCPFDFPEDPEREVALAPGAAWEIAVYPGMEEVGVWYEQRMGFGLDSATPGEARARVVITEDGTAREVTVSCAFSAAGVYATPDLDGGVSVGPRQFPTQERCRTLVEIA